LGQLPPPPKAARPVAVPPKLLEVSAERDVYVDALHPTEVVLLLQFVFFMQQQLQAIMDSGLSVRIPHTFSNLAKMEDPVQSGVLRGFVDDYPCQCTTCGRRFSTRKRLRVHHDMHFQKTQLTKQLTATRKPKPRGWYATAQTWTGVKGLVLGPKIFTSRAGDFAAEEDDVPWTMEALADLGEVPLDQRKRVCAVCCEALKPKWRSERGIFVCVDAVAVVFDSNSPLTFGDDGPTALPEEAFPFHRRCFLNTDVAARVKALEELGCPRWASEHEQPVAPTSWQPVLLQVPDQEDWG